MTDLLQARSEELLQAVRRLGFLILIGAGVALAWALYAGWGRMSLLLSGCMIVLGAVTTTCVRNMICADSLNRSAWVWAHMRDFSCPDHWAVPEQSLGCICDRRGTCSYLRAFPRIHLPWRYFFAHYAWGLSN